MSNLVRFFGLLYNISLKLYPAKFRTDFSEEMQYTFAEASQEVGYSAAKVLALYLRELFEWPGSVLREHLRAREWRLAIPQKHDHISKQFLIWIFASILGFGALGVAFILFTAVLSISGNVATMLIISIPIGLSQWFALRRMFPVSPLWIFTILAGLLLTFVLYKAIPEGLWLMFDDESIAVMTLTYLVFGFAIALPQWLILRQWFSKSSIWVLGSSLGVALSFWLVISSELVNRSGIVSYCLAALLYAITTGLVLVRLLSRHHKSGASVVNTL